jgi:hypothetical protein
LDELDELCPDELLLLELDELLLLDELDELDELCPDELDDDEVADDRDEDELDEFDEDDVRLLVLLLDDDELDELLWADDGDEDDDVTEDDEDDLSSIDRILKSDPMPTAGPGNCKAPVWKLRTVGVLTSPVERVSVNFACHGVLSGKAAV